MSQNLKYYDFTYDNDVSKFQYLPYLYNITKEYVDEFNKNIFLVMQTQQTFARTGHITELDQFSL